MEDEGCFAHLWPAPLGPWVLMKIVDRYVLREYLIPFGYCLCAFCLIYVIFDLFDRFPDFLKAEVPWTQALLFYGHFLFVVNGFVPFLVMVLPIALLLSEQYTLVTLAMHNELTAMRASGLSLYRLFAPFLTVGVIASLLAVLVQEVAGPYATRWKSNFDQEQIKKLHEVNLIPNFYYHTGKTARDWRAASFDMNPPGRLLDVKVTQTRKDGSLVEEFMAAKAEWLDGQWWFYDLHARKYDLRGEPVAGSHTASPVPVDMPEFKETPQDFITEFLKIDAQSSWEMYRYLQTHPNVARETRRKREVVLHERLAMPWTCLVVVLIGMPTVMTTNRRGALKSVMLSIGGLFGFYFLQQFGYIHGVVGHIPPWLAGWLPNIVCAGVGLYLLSRIRC